jgi:hypothetical protein
MSQEVCEGDPYKPTYQQGRPQAGEDVTGRAFNAMMSNMMTSGANMDGGRAFDSAGHRAETLAEKNAMLYHYKDSKVAQPVNLVPSDLMKCMNCGVYVHCNDMAGHLRSVHNVNLGHVDNLKREEEWGSTKRRPKDYEMEHAPKVLFSSVAEQSLLEPLTSAQKIALASDKPF